MSIVVCEDGRWTTPRIVPLGPVETHPAAMGIQFGQSIFEGCKAFRDDKATAHIFRLEVHHARFIASARRLCMPEIPERVFFDAVENLVRLQESWTRPFSSDCLYIRPILYGDDDHVMPLPSHRSTFVVLTAPLRLFATKPLALFAERKYTRAAKGGLGYAKTAANYAHQYLPTQRALEAGCDAILWLDAETHSSVEEASTMNLFMLLGGRLVTPELRDTILAGITRRSVIRIAREMLGIEVEERPISVDEIAREASCGNLTEMFTSSTALGVRPVARILDGERNTVLPDNRPTMDRIQEALLGIQRGEAPDPWSWTAPLELEASRDSA